MTPNIGVTKVTWTITGSVRGRCFDEKRCQESALDCRWDYNIKVKLDPSLGLCFVKHRGVIYRLDKPGDPITIDGRDLSLQCGAPYTDTVYIFSCSGEKKGAATFDFRCRKCPVADQP